MGERKGTKKRYWRGAQMHPTRRELISYAKRGSKRKTFHVKNGRWGERTGLVTQTAMS
jgi:hypothetical protein